MTASNTGNNSASPRTPSARLHVGPEKSWLGMITMGLDVREIRSEGQTQLLQSALPGWNSVGSIAAEFRQD